MISKFIKKIEWVVDYYFVWILYNGNKKHKYIEYMENKWGKNEK